MALPFYSTREALGRGLRVFRSNYIQYTTGPSLTSWTSIEIIIDFPTGNCWQSHTHNLLQFYLTPVTPTLRLGLRSWPATTHARKNPGSSLWPVDRIVSFGLKIPDPAAPCGRGTDDLVSSCPLTVSWALNLGQSRSEASYGCDGWSYEASVWLEAAPTGDPKKKASSACRLTSEATDTTKSHQILP